MGGFAWIKEQGARFIDPERDWGVTLFLRKFITEAEKWSHLIADRGADAFSSATRNCARAIAEFLVEVMPLAAPLANLVNMYFAFEPVFGSFGAWVASAVIEIALIVTVDTAVNAYEESLKDEAFRPAFYWSVGTVVLAVVVTVLIIGYFEWADNRAAVFMPAISVIAASVLGIRRWMAKRQADRHDQNVQDKLRTELDSVRDKLRTERETFADKLDSVHADWQTKFQDVQDKLSAVRDKQRTVAGQRRAKKNVKLSPADRQATMSAVLSELGVATFDDFVQDMAVRFGVSAKTVRRDLDVLSVHTTDNNEIYLNGVHA